MSFWLSPEKNPGRAKLNRGDTRPLAEHFSRSNVFKRLVPIPQSKSSSFPQNQYSPKRFYEQLTALPSLASANFREPEAAQTGYY